jgi:hypothetical protein
MVRIVREPPNIRPKEKCVVCGDSCSFWMIPFNIPVHPVCYKRHPKKAIRLNLSEVV